MLKKKKKFRNLLLCIDNVYIHNVVNDVWKYVPSFTTYCPSSMFVDFGGNISLRRKRHDPSIEWSDDGINCEYCSDVAWASSRLKPPATRLWVESSDSFHKCPVIWKACLCHDAIILRRVMDILSIGSKISLCYITWKHEFITDSMSTASLGIRWPAVISLFLVHRLPCTFTSNDGNYLIFSISFFSQFSVLH